MTWGSNLASKIRGVRPKRGRQYEGQPICLLLCCYFGSILVLFCAISVVFQCHFRAIWCYFNAILCHLDAILCYFNAILCYLVFFVWHRRSPENTSNVQAWQWAQDDRYIKNLIFPWRSIFYCTIGPQNEYIPLDIMLICISYFGCPGNICTKDKKKRPKKSAAFGNRLIRLFWGLEYRCFLGIQKKHADKHNI